MRAHEQRGRAEDEAIYGREIGRSLPGAIADEQLELEQQRLGGDGADATGAAEPREGDQLVDGKDEDLSHRSNRITTADARKTARSVRVASHCEFATHRISEPLGVRVGSVPGGLHHEHPPATANELGVIG
jgi:hypothetical protein